MCWHVNGFVEYDNLLAVGREMKGDSDMQMLEYFGGAALGRVCE